MKNILLFILLLMTQIARTQCLNNVSTNPLNPTNSALPDNTVLPNNDNKFLNRFNWFPVTNGFYSNYVPLDVSYAGITVGYLNNIMNNQFSPPYYNYIYDGPLPTGKNGWELLLLNLGRFPNNDPITDNDGKANGVPYIVLYNKYSGIVRVFVSFGVDGQGADAVDITLTFDSPQNGVSGNLRLNNGMDQALDQKTNVSMVKSVAKDPNLSYKWMSTDFQIAYDPCVCWHPSKLSIEVRKIDITLIEGVEGAISLENQPLVGNTNIVNPQNYLAGINYNEDTKKNGVVMYKTINNMIDNYIKKYEDYNKKLIEVNEHNEHVKRNLAMLKVAKTVSLLVATGATMGGTPLLIQNGELPIDAVMDYSLLETMNMPLETYQSLFMGLDEFSLNQVNLDFFSVALKKYNSLLSSSNKIKIETVFDIATKIFGEKAETFINQNFVTKDLPQKPSMPTATFTESKFSGQITNYGDTYGPKFFTPGTFKNQQVNAPTTVTSPYEYPIYNESLGIFALLKTPKVLISETVHENTPPNYFYHAWTKGYQIKLNEPISYYFNPSIDIVSKDVKFSYQIKARKKIIQNINNSNITSKCFIDPNYSSNLNAINCDIEKYSPVQSNTSSFENGANYPLVGQPTNLLNTSINIDTLELVSPYFSVDNFYSITAGIGLKNEILTNAITGPPVLNPDLYGFILDFDVYLKVLVNVKYNTLGEGNKPNSTTMLLTYKVPNDASHVELISTEIVPNLENSIGNITQYEEDLTFKDVVFNGSAVNGCKLTGTTYTCQAWNDIRIFGNLSTTNGFKVNLIAGNQIETFPESVISPEISLSIVPVLDYSQPMPEATPTYVSSFCNPAGQNYQADLFNKTAKDSIVDAQNASNSASDVTSQLERSEFNFQLFPNPSSQLTTVLVEGNEFSVAAIQVYDVMGKEQTLTIQGQNGQYQFDVSTLSKGMYFVKVNSFGASKTKQLIVK